MNRRRTALVVSFVGLTLLVVSYLIDRLAEGWSAWWSGILVEIGVTAILVTPLYLVGRMLESRIRETSDRVEQVQVSTTSGMADLADRVSAFEGDVDRRLDQIARSVSESLDEAAAEDAAVFDGLVNRVDRAAVVAALELAVTKDLVDPQRPPRVLLSDRLGLYVTFALGTPDYLDRQLAALWGAVMRARYPNASTFGYGTLAIVLEKDDGTTVDVFGWVETEAAGVMVHLANLVHREYGDSIDVVGLFEGLRDTFKVGNSGPAFRPVVQLCPPQWVVTSDGIAAYSRPREDAQVIPHADLRRQDVQDQLWGEVWLDDESFQAALNASLKLFPAPPETS